jgi:hypothetical protein
MVHVVDLDTLLAEHAIRAALVDYSRGVDRGDTERVLAAYHPDGVDHHGTWDGVAHEALPAALQRLLERTISTVHFLGESSFEWAERSVQVETNVLALHLVRHEPDTSIEHLHGRYLDVFTCVDGDWRISERTFVHDADFLDAASTRAYPDGIFVQGARNAEDPTS